MSEANAESAAMVAFLAIAGIWCLCLFVSTKGCREFTGEGQLWATNNDDPVWRIQSIGQASSDLALARRLQNEERQAVETSISVEEAKAERDKQIQLRKDFVERAIDNRQVSELDCADLGACAICLAEFRAGDTVTTSTSKRCQHAFHTECIVAWLIRHSTCPSCREVFLKEDFEEKKAKCSHVSSLGGGPDLEATPP